MRRMLKFAMRFNNLYGEVGNPLFESDGVVFRRAVMPSDLTGYLPDDLVVPIRGATGSPTPNPWKPATCVPPLAVCR